MPGMDGFINFNGTLKGSIAGGGGGDVTDVKVRNSQESTFESVVNEQGVAEIDLISYVRRNELSQAIENVENSIDNVEQLIDTKQNKYDYSTTPVDTGQKWIDGKTIYCKVLDLGSDVLFESGWIKLSIPHGNDIDNIIKASAVNSAGYSVSIGFACNDPTYFEVECYRATHIRYIIYYYTKN